MAEEEPDISVGGMEEPSGAGVKVTADPKNGDNQDDVGADSSGIEQVTTAPSLDDTQQEVAVVSLFKDHFTLPVASSTVRYRKVHSAARVIDGVESQVVLEEAYNPKSHKHEVSIRMIPDTSEGVKFLRISYTVVTAFFTGFLFVFCLEVLLFLVLDLAAEVGATSSQNANYGAALGVLFSILPFVYGLASALVIAGAFISDTWHGHTLVRNFTLRGMSPVVVEWIFFAFFLGLPLFVMGLCLISRVDIWWQITSLFWFSCVGGFYVLFTFNVIFYEMRACWEVTRNFSDDDINSYWDLIKKSVLLRQVSAYSGRKTISYLSMGSVENAEYTDAASSQRNTIQATKRESLDWKAKVTGWGCWSRCRSFGLVEQLEEPERIYTVDDARDIRPYLTSQSWSLEKVFCRAKDSRYVAIVRGPGALTRAQMRSSLVCSIIGIFLIFLFILALLVWLELGGAFTCLVLAAAILVATPSLRSSYKLFKVTKGLTMVRTEAKKHDAEDGEAQADNTEVMSRTESEGVYLVWEKYRVNRATPRFCCIMLFLEITIFFVWPLVSLFLIGNYPLGVFFILVASFTGMRYYINAAVVLEETGHMDLVDGATEEELWKNQSRLNVIVGNITRGRSRRAWMTILGFFGFVFVALFLGAVGSEEEDTYSVGYTYLPDFEYLPQDDSLRYPSCKLTSDLGDSPLTSMADYAFLAGLAYRSINGTQSELDGWFGPSGTIPVDQVETVEQFREDNEITSAVSFKLVTFPDSGNFAYVLIRGTQNNWDMLADVQLWGGAALMQALRALMPLGEMWTPIIAQLLQIIPAVESASIDRVAFYRTTSEFVEFLKAQPNNYSGVAITGHSLGGGLSIISGAQTGTPAVALSGPNAMLSRRTFDPPVSSGELDSKTFNIIPARDPVPMLDDRAQNFQEIRCDAATNDPIGCHDSTRSLCEIMVTCGSNEERPPICDCTRLFNYAEPVATGNRTFAEACPLP